MKSDTAFVIPVFTHTVDNWSDYKEEIIDMLDTGDGIEELHPVHVVIMLATRALQKT